MSKNHSYYSYGKMKFAGIGMAIGLVFGGLLVGVLVGNPFVFAGWAIVLSFAIGSALDRLSAT